MLFTHYYLERMVSYKQVEIEKQAREAWKFTNKKDEKETNSILEPLKTTEKSVLVTPSCCACEC